MQNKGWVLAAVMAMAGGAAYAADNNNDPFYIGVSGLYEIGDSARDSDSGKGFQLNFGYPLAQRPGDALEVSLFALERDRDFDGKEDYQRGLVLNYVRQYSEYKWNAAEGESQLLSFRPYLLGGIGAVQEDVSGDKHFHVALNAGAGLLFPIGFKNWAIRTEALAQAQLNDKSVPAEDFLLDFQVRVGVQIPLNFAIYRDVKLAPLPEEPARVVPVEQPAEQSVEQMEDVEAEAPVPIPVDE